MTKKILIAIGALFALLVLFKVIGFVAGAIWALTKIAVLLTLAAGAVYAVSKKIGSGKGAGDRVERGPDRDALDRPNESGNDIVGGSGLSKAEWDAINRL